MDGREPVDGALVARTAEAILAAFRDYNDEFARITRRAARRFAEREWGLGRRDAVERIELYDRRVEGLLANLVGRMGRWIADEATWSAVRGSFAELIRDCADREFHQTFFNSLTRKVFATEGVNPGVEFDALECAPQLTGGLAPFRSYSGTDPADLATRILAQFPHCRSEGEPLAGHAAGVLRVAAALNMSAESPLVVEMLEPVFYRGTRAFLVGRVVRAERTTGLVIAFRNDEAGPAVDAVITADPAIRNLFGFARSYFHVDLDPVGPVVEFLRTLMPRKSLAELYTVLGRAKQGKTERYRSLYAHLESSDDRFVHAEGQRGMVMLVFTLGSYDSVFKVIRDRFPFPKTTSRPEVEDRYLFVFEHDRVGRLVDAQEFRRLRFPRSRFAPELLDELLRECAGTCRLEGDDLIIGHCYIERRLKPLDVYLQTAEPAAARAAIRDYGRAIRELAMSNIFPGDLLLKNFGVSRNGRVIFYDYDELCLVTDCTYRDLPRARFDEDETRGEPWFYVGPNDVFPEQFLDFLGLRGELREEFLAHHADLLTADYWRGLKAAHQAERWLEVLPYPSETGEAVAA
jgi:isocitrate dehydrogenase kinase/phosphatase